MLFRSKLKAMNEDVLSRLCRDRTAVASVLWRGNVDDYNVTQITSIPAIMEAADMVSIMLDGFS